MLNWYAITSTAYYAAEAETLSEENLYFLTDTHEIYRGTVPFTDSVITYSGEEPTSPARKKIYVNTSTLEGKIYDGTSWTTIIKPVSTTVTESDANPVSGGAVYDYVAQALQDLSTSENTVKGITYNKGEFKLVVEKGDDSTEDVVLEGFAVDLNYVPSTGLLQIKDATGAPVGTGINLDLERFVSAAAYDATSKQIILAFTNVTSIDTGASYTYPDSMPGSPSEGMACRAGGTWYIYTDSAWAEIGSTDTPLTINVGDLVDTYTAKDSQTVHMTVSDNQFTASVLVSATGGNMIQTNADGLYVAATDLSNYQTLVESASTTMIPMLDENGQIINGTMTPGGATIAETPNATTLATEAAVKALVESTISNITTSLGNKMDKVTSAVENNIATFDDAGSVKDSGVKVGGATISSSPDNTTLATEVAVNAAVAAVDAKVTTLNADQDTPGSVDYKIAQATENMLETTDIVTTLSASNTDQQVPSAKVVYDQLVWKTSL